MEKQRIIISEMSYKRYRFLIATLILVIAIVWLFMKNPEIRWYDWLLCVVLFLVAITQLAMATGKADCFIEIDNESIGIKLVDENKPQTLKISEIKQIALLPERRFSIEIEAGTYTFKYRDLKDAEIKLIEKTLIDFAAKNNIELTK